MTKFQRLMSTINAKICITFDNALDFEMVMAFLNSNGVDFTMAGKSNAIKCITKSKYIACVFYYLHDCTLTYSSDVDHYADHKPQYTAKEFCSMPFIKVDIIK